MILVYIVCQTYCTLRLSIYSGLSVAGHSGKSSPIGHSSCHFDLHSLEGSSEVNCFVAFVLGILVVEEHCCYCYYYCC